MAFKPMGRSWRAVGSFSVLLLSIVAIGTAGTGLARNRFSAAAPVRPKRLILVSWDGAGDWVIDRMLAEGKLPNVARLVATGVRSEGVRPAWPSKTACGHAAIWTGAYSDVNGISGNWVPIAPRAEHTLLEDQSGFHSTALEAEPLWVAAARGGKKVVVLSSTHTFPSDNDRAAMRDARIPEDRLRTFSGFESRIASPRVFTAADLRPAQGAAWKIPAASAPAAREVEFKVGDTVFFALVYDDPVDPATGVDSVLIRQESRDPKIAVAEATVKPREAAKDFGAFSPRFRVTKGDLFGFTYFRLFALSPDGSSMTLYQRSVNGLQGHASRADIETYTDAYGGFHDEAFYDVYGKKQFGAPLWEGGDGTAERRLLETIRLDVEFRIRSIRYAMKAWNPDVVFHYTSTTDGAGHTWIGALDPAGRNYDPKLAEKLWPFYEEVFQLEDLWLGHLIEAAGQEGVVCLVSDHGMAATDTLFYPNTVLQQAGLLVADGRKIRLEQTEVCVPPFSDFFLTVNGVDRKGGIVKPADREAALRRAEDALLAARDPRDGRRIVRAVFRPGETLGLGIDGDSCGDLYFELMPGYYPMSRLSPNVVEPDDPPIGSGNHGFFPFRRSMQAIFILGGGGVSAGRSIGPIRQIDIAPTLARLIGVPAPGNAYGHAIWDVAPE